MKYPKIETEEQYWEEFNKWKSKLDQIKSSDIIKNPHIYLPKLQEILLEGVEREVISQEFYEKKINKLNKELNASARLKGSIEEKKEYIKKKAREYFKK